MNKPSSPADLLTLEQVQEILQVSESSVRTYIRTGRLPAMKIGGDRLLRVRRRDLDALLVPVDTDGEERHEQK